MLLGWKKWLGHRFCPHREFTRGGKTWVDITLIHGRKQWTKISFHLGWERELGESSWSSWPLSWLQKYKLLDGMHLASSLLLDFQHLKECMAQSVIICYLMTEGICVCRYVGRRALKQREQHKQNQSNEELQFNLVEASENSGRWN